MDVGKRIAARRKKQGLTQVQFAERLGVSFQAVSNWERGETVPELARMEAIAQVLDTTVSFLLDGVTAEEPRTGGREELYDEERMFTYIKSFAASHEFFDTCRALPFARACHAGQFREGSGTVPFLVHPLNITCHAIALGLREDSLLAAALLHDVCEMCGVTPEELPVGEAAREAVRLLSFRHEEGQDLREEKARYFAGLLENREALMVKLLARCHNVSFMAYGFSTQRLHDYIAETREFLFPLLRQARDRWPEYSNALYLIKYHLCALTDSMEAVLLR